MSENVNILGEAIKPCVKLTDKPKKCILCGGKVFTFGRLDEKTETIISYLYWCDNCKTHYDKTDFEG